MNKKTTKKKNFDFKEYLANKLKNLTFRTSQSNIARMEEGEQNFTTETLYKVTTALKREFKIDFVRQ